MKIVHVSPTYFADASVVGGGERYAQELARAMAGLAPTTFISLGAKRMSRRDGSLQIEILPARDRAGRRAPPVSADFLRLVTRADVVHCHQLGTPVNVLAMVVARLRGTRCFVTPLGASPTRAEHRIMRLVGFTGFLCISAFSARTIPYLLPSCVIGGGVDAERFRATGQKERKIVSVARLLPHKGLNYLIEAVESDMPLEIYGRPYDRRHLDDLLRLAAGKPVRIVTDASDEDIATAYSSALVTVLPSVYRDMYGTSWAEPELLGLTLLESMACGTAVIGTRVGAIPEHVREGETGYLVPPNDPAALRQALHRLLDNPALAVRLGARGREVACRDFSWVTVARRCLDAYDTVRAKRHLVLGVRPQPDPL